jgi:hypothetical protein
MRILCTFRKNSKDHQKQKIGNNVVSKNSKDHQKIEIRNVTEMLMLGFGNVENGGFK